MGVIKTDLDLLERDIGIRKEQMRHKFYSLTDWTDPKKTKHYAHKISNKYTNCYIYQHEFFMIFYEQMTGFGYYPISTLVSQVIGARVEIGNWATMKNRRDLCMEIDHQIHGNWVGIFFLENGQ